MDSKKLFWIIAVVAALAGVAATVAYFVVRCSRRRCAEQLSDLYDDCDNECDCCCEPKADLQ